MLVKDTGTLYSRLCGSFYYEISYDGPNPDDPAYVPDYRVASVMIDARSSSCPVRVQVYSPPTDTTPFFEQTFPPGTFETYTVPQGQKFRLNNCRYTTGFLPPA